MIRDTGAAIGQGVPAEAGRDDDLNFTPSINALFETDLKLRVGVSRPYSDNYNDFQIVIAYDPEIRADRLTMPRPASDDRDDRPAQLVPFQSDRSIELTRLNGRINHLPQFLDLVMRDIGRGFATDVRLIEQRCEPLRGRGLSVIHQALKAAVRLPAWDAEDVTVRDANGNIVSAPPRDRVRMLVQPSLAVQLANDGLLRLASAPTCDTLLSERGL